MLESDLNHVKPIIPEVEEEVVVKKEEPEKEEIVTKIEPVAKPKRFYKRRK